MLSVLPPAAMVGASLLRWFGRWAPGSVAGRRAAAGCGGGAPLSFINTICIVWEQVATTSFAISVPATCPLRNSAF